MKFFEMSDLPLAQCQDLSGIATLAHEISEISERLMATNNVLHDENSRNQARIRELEAQVAELQTQIRVISAQNSSLEAQLNLLITSRF